MKKILITGASGFVGSFLVEESLRRGLEVHAGVRKTSKRTYLRDERIRFFEVDFPDAEGMKKRLFEARFDYVIHNAGIVGGQKKADYFRVNFEYTQRFVEAIQRVYVPEKFTYISSLSAYGPASGEDLSDFVKAEDDPHPITTYGKSKLASEKMLASQPEFPYLIIRPTVVYGPREKELFTFFKLVNRYFEPYIGFQKQHLSFIFVKDLARVVVDATLSSESRKGYFVSDGHYYSSRDLGSLARQFLHKKTFRVTVPVPIAKVVAAISETIAKISGKHSAFNLEKMGELTARNWKCDIKPLRRDFNFQPEYNLEKGLEETIRWYRETGWL